MSESLQAVVAYLHVFTGGTMLSSQAAYDPIFFFVPCLHWYAVLAMATKTQARSWQLPSQVLEHPSPTIPAHTQWCYGFRGPFVWPMHCSHVVPHAMIPRARKNWKSKYLRYYRHDYDDYGFDSIGYNILGFNTEGYNRDGYDMSGFDVYGYDRLGFDLEGFNKWGYNKQGMNRAGGNGRDRCLWDWWSGLGLLEQRRWAQTIHHSQSHRVIRCGASGLAHILIISPALCCCSWRLFSWRIWSVWLWSVGIWQRSLQPFLQWSVTVRCSWERCGKQ